MKMMITGLDRVGGQGNSVLTMQISQAGWVGYDLSTYLVDML